MAGADRASWITPAWVTAGEVTLTGGLLSEVGLRLPALWPAQAVVLHLTAVAEA